MKGSPRSLWLSTASRVAGWWMGYATNAWRQAQRAAARAATRKAQRPPPRER
jgi:hypothetical protein